MVPFILGKVYSQIIASFQGKRGWQRHLHNYALKLTRRYDPMRLPWSYRLQLCLADLLVYSTWRKETGSRLHTIICGGAAIPLHLLKFFWAIKIPVYEIYGATETSSLISVNCPGKVRLGSVGIPYESVDVRLSEEDELLCRGACITPGYFNKPELTRDAIDSDGFFHTGDNASIDKDGFITLTGRKKEMFKTASGEFIHPVFIESRLKQSGFIDQVLVVGANRDFLSALILPETDRLRDWCTDHQVKTGNPEELFKNEKVLQLFRTEIDRFNETPLEKEKIKKFVLLPDKWTVGGGELSAFMKLKRKSIEQKYKAVIDNLYP